MIAYKNYCNRREVRQAQDAEETHCCPSRMPIIGPILFSLFIFSPFILPSSDTDNIQNQTQDSLFKEKLPPEDDSLRKMEGKDKDHSNPQPW